MHRRPRTSFSLRDLGPGSHRQASAPRPPLLSPFRPRARRRPATEAREGAEADRARGGSGLEPSSCSSPLTRLPAVQGDGRSTGSPSFSMQALGDSSLQTSHSCRPSSGSGPMQSLVLRRRPLWKWARILVLLPPPDTRVERCVGEGPGLVALAAMVCVRERRLDARHHRRLWGVPAAGRSGLDRSRSHSARRSRSDLRGRRGRLGRAPRGTGRAGCAEPEYYYYYYCCCCYCYYYYYC